MRELLLTTWLMITCTVAIAAIPQAIAPSGIYNGKSSMQVFLGIPYAVPPVGEYRWRPPQEIPSQTSAISVDKYGKSSLQQYKNAHDVSEDCLYLNVRTPAVDEARRPVCVFIHGGGNTMFSGAEELWQGTSFVRDDIVFVTINYRLGAAGFLYLDELDSSFKQTGYLGLLDQIAALKWVKKNIAAFGGDPDNITVMGESAGAAAISLLLTMPQAHGLFERAIIESGSTNLRRTRADAKAIAERFVKFAGVNDAAALRTLSSAQLLAAQEKLMNEYGWLASDLLFAPVSDGVQLPDEPLRALRQGVAKGVAVLSGTNRDEMNLFKLWAPSGYINFTTFRWFAPRDTQSLFGYMDSAADDYYSNLYPSLGAADLFYRAGTDAIFLTPQIDFCDAQSTSAPVYSYRFDWQSKYGAIHGLELYFIFDDIRQDYFDNWLVGRPPEQLRESMHAAWAQFIKTGSPALGATLLWMPYNAIQRPTMTLDTKSRLRCDPDKTVRQYWQQRERGYLYQ